MAKYQIIVKPKAETDFLKIERSGDKSSIKKLETIILELAENPYNGSGQPEQLKHNLSGYWSRRINKKDRLIYQVIEEPDKFCGYYLRSWALVNFVTPFPLGFC